MTFYDNNANNIEYFDLHKPEKPKRKNLDELSDQELLDIQVEIQEKHFGLTELYNQTKNQSTFNKLEKLTGFKTAIRIQMRTRKLESYEKINLRLISYEGMIKELQANKQQPESQKERIANLNNKLMQASRERDAQKSINKQLSGKLNKIEKLYTNQLTVNRALNQAEKTKRLELSLARDLRIFQEFKKLASDRLGEFDYIEMIRKASNLADAE